MIYDFYMGKIFITIPRTALVNMYTCSTIEWPLFVDNPVHLALPFI